MSQPEPWETDAMDSTIPEHPFVLYLDGWVCAEGTAASLLDRARTVAQQMTSHAQKPPEVPWLPGTITMIQADGWDPERGSWSEGPFHLDAAPQPCGAHSPLLPLGTGERHGLICTREQGHELAERGWSGRHASLAGQERFAVAWRTHENGATEWELVPREMTEPRA